MNKTTRKTKWFWPWQDDKEEVWLEQMSRQGLHLKQAQVLAQYDFVQGVPADYTYRLDFQDGLKQKKKAYLQLFADAGWEYIGQLNGWQYFRQPAVAGKAPEIFTDPDSKIKKYNRYLTYLGAIYSSYLVVFVALWSNWPEWMMWLYIAVILTLSALTVGISVKIQQRIRQLKTLQ